MTDASEPTLPAADGAAPSASSGSTPQASGPLHGLRIGVTASRRITDQVGALERQGAEAVSAPTMRIVPVQDDAQLIADTRTVLQQRPGLFFVTTAQGFTNWLDALPEDLRADALAYLAETQIVCRGAKGRGAVRAAGLPDAPASPGETSASMVQLAKEIGIPAGPIGLQRHGYLHPDVTRDLEADGDGHELIVVAPYRWEPPSDLAPMDELIEGLISGTLHAVTFTAAPAVQGLLERAQQTGRREQLVRALRTHAVAVAVGHVSAEPLEAEGIDALYPQRERLGAMVQLMAAELPTRLGR